MVINRFFFFKLLLNKRATFFHASDEDQSTVVNVHVSRNAQESEQLFAAKFKTVFRIIFIAIPKSPKFPVSNKTYCSEFRTFFPGAFELPRNSVRSYSTTVYRIVRHTRRNGFRVRTRKYHGIRVSGFADRITRFRHL